MKRLILLALIFGLIIVTTEAKERTINRPSFTAWSGGALEIDKVVLNDSSTVLYINAFYSPKMWIRIDKGSCLKAEGKSYPILSMQGAVLDSLIWMPESGTRSFTMCFPPLPKGIKEVDFTEGDQVEGAFKIWGIRLDGKPLRPLIKKNKTKKELVKLPDVQMEYAEAFVQGKLLGMPHDYTPFVTLSFTDCLTNSYRSLEVKINQDGAFEQRLPLLLPTNVTLSFGSQRVNMIVVPGKTCFVEVNLPEVTRQQSKLRTGESSLGDAYRFSGELAAINNECANGPRIELSMRPTSFDDFLNEAKVLYTASFEEATAYYERKYGEQLKKIEANKEMSEARRQLLKDRLDLSMLENLFQITIKEYKAYLFQMLKKSMPESVGDTFEFVKPTVDYAALIKKYLPNESRLPYIPDLSSRLQILVRVNYLDREQPQSQQERDRWSQNNYYMDDFFRVSGIDSGLVADLLKSQVFTASLKDFQPLTAAQKEQLSQFPVPLQKALLVMNDELLQTIEENKKKSGYTVDQVNIKEIPEEELFSAIIAPYRGKVVLVDFWATWCGPCLGAMKKTEPIKEKYHSEEVVFLYLAGENSPKGVWQQKITDIKGEHYRLSDKQWKYLSEKFKIQGVPTYLIVAKDGTIAHLHTGFMGVETLERWFEEELKK